MQCPRAGRSFVLVSLALLLCGLATLLAPAGAPRGPVIATVNGEWSAKFWQWLYSVPLADNPAFDPTGDDASNGQPPGSVFFLCGTFTLAESSPGVILGQADRTIRVPYGKTFVFPLVNAEFDNLGLEPPLSTAELRAKAADAINHTVALACAIDGVAIPEENLFAYFRVASPKFNYFLPDNNIAGVPSQLVKGAVSDGYYVAVSNLSPGRHTISWYAALDLREEFGFVFIQDIRYTINVLPRRQ